MKTVLITPPVKEPITMPEVKAQCRITIDTEDDLIDRYIVTARKRVENVLGRALITQTWDYYLDDWPGRDYIVIPYGQLQSVTHVKYTDTASAQTEWSNTEYNFDIVSDPGRVILEYGYTWPSASLHPENPIVIRFVCGYGTAKADVPEPIRQAILFYAAQLYENREPFFIGPHDMKEVPLGFWDFLGDYRLHRFGEPN